VSQPRTAEQKRVDDAASWYLTDQNDVDRRLIFYRYQTMKPWLKGPQGLEMGPADGQMTRYLVGDFERLTVLDGAAELLAQIPDSSNLAKVHCLFEAFTPDRVYDTIILDHILEHVEDPVFIMQLAKRWLATDGRLMLGVPNGRSLHRLAAVPMGLLSHPCQLNARDLAQGHRRVYTMDTLRTDIEAAGLHVQHMGGVFIKPLSNQQIQKQWTGQMMDAYFEVGKLLPDITADLFAVCTLP
jgi:2-polyprenyl-3-methyl-5-hydroxy-6-metoxy-1,4-benzoquinol methylase